MMPDLAPIVFFTYNRPNHTRKSLLALSENTLAPDSKLYIFCDGTPASTSEENIKNNNLVKKVIREKNWCGKVEIIESSFNKGLAKSVIEGIEEILNKYGKIIVLEDDLITSTYFLEYMNKGLVLYENDPKVAQISGFTYAPPSLLDTKSSFFLPLTTTWGWATWKRVWEICDFECKDYTLLKQDEKLAYQFNYNNSYNFKKMFVQQMESNKVSSWGIRFYWNIFKQQSVVLYPEKSLVKNIGWDNSGKHNDSYEIYPVKDWNPQYKVKNYPINSMLEIKFEKEVQTYIKKRTSFFLKLIHLILKFLHLKNKI